MMIASQKYRHQQYICGKSAACDEGTKNEKEPVISSFPPPTLTFRSKRIFTTSTVCFLLLVDRVASARSFRPSGTRGFVTVSRNAVFEEVGGDTAAADTRQKEDGDDDKENGDDDKENGDDDNGGRKDDDDGDGNNKENGKEDDDDDDELTPEDEGFFEDTIFPTQLPTWIPTTPARGEDASNMTVAEGGTPSSSPTERTTISATPTVVSLSTTINDDEDTSTSAVTGRPTGASTTSAPTTSPTELGLEEDLFAVEDITTNSSISNVTVAGPTGSNNINENNTMIDSINVTTSVADDKEANVVSSTGDSLFTEDSKSEDWYDTVTTAPSSSSATLEPIPTMAPTAPAANSDAPRLDAPVVTGQLTIQLIGIDKPFYESNRMLFLAGAEAFISTKSAGIVNDLRVIVIHQRLVSGTRRRLQSSSQQRELLQVDLGVDGLASEGSELSATDWNQLLFDLFQEEGLQFVSMIHEMSSAEGNSFFEPLESVAALEPPRGGAPTAAPTVKTLNSQASPSPVTNNDHSSGKDGGGDEGIPLIATLGGAVGGCLFLIAGVLLVRLGLRYQKQKNTLAAAEKKQGNSQNTQNIGSLPSSIGNDTAIRGTTNNSSAGRIHTKPSTGECSVSSESYLTNSAMHSQNYNSYINSQSGRHLMESDTQSQMGGTTAGDMSIMSYAYSLEPGIEPSLAGIPQSVVPSMASAMSFSAYPSGASVASMTSGASSFAFMKQTLGSKSSGSGFGNVSSLAGKPTTDVLAPPGKLGIVIDTTIEGPVVHKVNPGSALEGSLKSGDIIVAIDDVDTRAMTASAITALMVQTANQRRKLTVVNGRRL